MGKSVHQRIATTGVLENAADSGAYWWSGIEGVPMAIKGTASNHPRKVHGASCGGNAISPKENGCNSAPECSWAIGRKGDQQVGKKSRQDTGAFLIGLPCRLHWNCMFINKAPGVREPIVTDRLNGDPSLEETCPTSAKRCLDDVKGNVLRRWTRRGGGYCTEWRACFLCSFWLNFLLWLRVF